MLEALRDIFAIMIGLIMPDDEDREE